MPQKKHRRQPSSQSGFPYGSGFPTSLSTGVGVNLGGLNGLTASSNLSLSHDRAASNNSNLLSFTPFFKLGSNLNNSNNNNTLGSLPSIDPSAELDRIAREILVKSDRLKPLNEKVLRRHNPAVDKVLHIVPYSVVYSFSPSSQAWEKCNIEGSLFVVELRDPSEDSGNDERGRHDEKGRRLGLSVKRFAVMILNRRSLENFCVELNDPHDVDVTAEYIMLQGVNTLQKEPTNPQTLATAITTGNGSSAPTSKIYGLWIFSETQTTDNGDSIPTSTPTAVKSAGESASSVLKKTADIVQLCACEAEQSRMAMAARAASVAAQTPTLEAFSNNGSLPQTPHDAPPLKRQLSLRDLFGEQRAQDSGWSTRPPPSNEEGPSNQSNQDRESGPSGPQNMDFLQFGQNPGPPPGLGFQPPQQFLPDHSNMPFPPSAAGFSHRPQFSSGFPGSICPPQGMPPPGLGPVDPYSVTGYHNPLAVPGRYPPPTLPPHMQQGMPPGLPLQMGMLPMQGFPSAAQQGNVPTASPNRFGTIGNQAFQLGQQRQYSPHQYGVSQPQGGRGPPPSASSAISQNTHLLGLFGNSGTNSPAMQAPIAGAPNSLSGVPFGGHDLRSYPPPANVTSGTPADSSVGLSRLSPSTFFQMAASGGNRQPGPTNVSSASTNAETLNVAPTAYQSKGLLALFGSTADTKK